MPQKSSTDSVTELATIERAYRVRLRLKPASLRTLQRLLGAKRFVWNWAIRRKEEAWRADGSKLNGIALSREFTALKQQPETDWLSTLPREPFNQVLRDFDTAWSNFFAGRARRPRRKKFGTVNAVRFTLDQRRSQVDSAAGTNQLDGVGRVRFKQSEPLLGRLRSVTVSRNAAGQWHATLTADRVPKPASQTPVHAVIGIDLGLKSTAALSNGQLVAAPKHLSANLRRLRRYQRRMTRQRDAAARSIGIDPSRPLPKGTRLPVSNRQTRTKRKIGMLHVRISDARNNHQHQLTHQIVKTAQIISIEDLAVKAMSRGMGRKAFRRSVGAPAWARSGGS